jgi:hypothetical protein
VKRNRKQSLHRTASQASFLEDKYFCKPRRKGTNSSEGRSSPGKPHKGWWSSPKKTGQWPEEEEKRKERKKEKEAVRRDSSWNQTMQKNLNFKPLKVKTQKMKSYSGSLVRHYHTPILHNSWVRHYHRPSSMIHRWGNTIGPSSKIHGCCVLHNRRPILHVSWVLHNRRPILHGSNAEYGSFKTLFKYMSLCRSIQILRDFCDTARQNLGM